MKKRKNKVLPFLLITVLLFLLIRIALYDGLIVRRYDLTASCISAPHIYVLLTDLHSTLYGKEQERLIDTVKCCEPEAVFLVGDIADDKRSFDNTAALLEKLCPAFPCYYVTGNHERWVDYTDDIRQLIASLGAVVLDESSCPLLLSEEIRLFGINDPLFYENTNEYLACLSSFQTSEETFDLLLAHRPEFYENYRNAGFDLTLCGHAHGGQVRIPLLMNGLYAPNQGFFPKYAGGLYTFPSGQSMLVSRGLMKNELPRVFNPPEVCVIHLLPAE